MTHLDIPQAPQPGVSPTLLMGAAPPLWGYFAAATASGVAFWWMTCWTRPVNLEAFFAATSPQALPVPEPVAELVQVVAHEPEAEMVAALAPAMTEDDVALMDVAPVMEASPESDPEPALEAAAELVADRVPKLETVETTPPVLKSRARKMTVGDADRKPDVALGPCGR